MDLMGSETGVWLMSVNREPSYWGIKKTAYVDIALSFELLNGIKF